MRHQRFRRQPTLHRLVRLQLVQLMRLWLVMTWRWQRLPPRRRKLPLTPLRARMLPAAATSSLRALRLMLLPARNPQPCLVLVTKLWAAAALRPPKMAMALPQRQ